MYKKHLTDSQLQQLIERIDIERAQETQQGGCPRCGGNLHWASYPRKPRGGPAEWDSRLSLCCGQEGCRRRQTPPSVRFLGRKVYTGLIVVLASAMNQGLSPWRVERLRKVLGVTRRTLQRWRQWWVESFVRSRLWQDKRAWFMPPVDDSELPQSLCERFGAENRHGALNLLRFMAELSDSRLPPPKGI